MTIDDVLEKTLREIQSFSEVNPDTGNVRRKSFEAIPGNLVYKAAKAVQMRRIPQAVFNYSPESFARDCEIADAFFETCTKKQRNMLKDMLSGVLATDRWRKKQAAEHGSSSRYIDPIKPDNFFGGPLLAMAQAFDVNLKSLEAA